MGIPSEMRDLWVQKRKGFVIASPVEDQKILNARNCTRGSTNPDSVLSIL
jgi:hypothetical protein